MIAQGIEGPDHAESTDVRDLDQSVLLMCVETSEPGEGLLSTQGRAWWNHGEWTFHRARASTTDLGSCRAHSYKPYRMAGF